MIKLLIGGSPCTHWSIAQKNNRETEPEGLGWELFKNYLIAKEKFKPDYFLYENNKSASQAIKDQISKELDVDLMYINSALVSAQNRQRFYAFNWEVEQPEDRGIVLRDILESNVDEKAYSICAPQNERVSDCVVDKPIRIGTIENNLKNQKHNSKQYRVYSPDGKSTTLCGQGGGVGAKTGLYATPINITEDGKSQTLKAQYSFTSIPNICCYNSTYGATGVATLTDEPVSEQFMGEGKDWDAMKRVYEVKDGFITIKGKPYSIKLLDGHYIIRKLTVKECCRLQTLPDDYCRAVSNSQAYKGLGNGWTAEIIIHLLNGVLKDVPRDEEIVVLSMYDGIGTGRYCLDKMGFTNVKYYAYEIDKYAKQMAMSNYPDIIQMGNAFDLRHPDWTIGY
jgi:DNA (cytosine-5)-methyltransferase 3A